MKTKAISDLCFLLVMFVYMVSDNWFEHVYEDEIWTLIIYGSIGFYIFVNKFVDIKYAIKSIHKVVFIGTGIYFLYYWITKGIVLFDIEDKYGSWIKRIDIYGSGGIVLIMVLIFICMTIKTNCNDIKRIRR